MEWGLVGRAQCKIFSHDRWDQLCFFVCSAKDTRVITPLFGMKATRPDVYYREPLQSSDCNQVIHLESSIQ
jgi:hypothetical protein